MARRTSLKKKTTSNVVSISDVVRNSDNFVNELTVIIPIRTEDFSFYRQKLAFRDNCDLRGVVTMVIDDGSSEKASSDIIRFCNERNWKYVRSAEDDLEFSLSRARNAGLLAAKTEWLYLDDADMLYTRDFFQKIIGELKELDHSPLNFFSVPAVYLTKEATDLVWDRGDLDTLVPRFTTQMLFEAAGGSEVNKVLLHYAPASAMLALRRKTALVAGGYSMDFEGWGGEDRDFVFRLLMQNRDLPKPPDFEATKAWKLYDTHVFEGWRSLYRLIGEFCSRKGLYAFHAFHEPLAWRGAAAKTNLTIAASKAKEYINNGKVPTLSAPEIREDIIVGYNPFLVDSCVRETLNNPLIIDEDPRCSPCSYAQQIADREPNSVLMWNPYGSEWRLKVYRELIDKGIKPIVGERGALPDSIYFDTGGLCIESSSYREENWKRDLTDDEAIEARSYLNSLRFSDNALEKQGQRVGVRKLREALGIPDGKRILFAPLQLYDDTVTLHFSEKGRSYHNYIEELKNLSFSLPNDWVLVFKNHPLSLKHTDLKSSFCADKFHINDLLEASDAVTVFNSGTGLLASAFEKPVLYYGPCFYATDGLHWRFSDAAFALSFIRNTPHINIEKQQALFYYLGYKFYSFGKMVATEAKQTDFSKRSKLTSLKYRVLRIPGFPERRFGTTDCDLYPSILFDVYRHHAIQSKTRQPSVPSLPPTKPKPAPTKPAAASAKALVAKPAAAPAKAVDAKPVAAPTVDAKPVVQVVAQTKTHAPAAETYASIFKKACDAYHKGQFDEAATLFVKASGMAGSSPAALRCAAEAYVRGDEHKQAIKLLEEASAKLPDNGNIRKRLEYLKKPKLARMLSSAHEFAVPL